MATVFETKLIGNIGKDATIKNMERGVVAINFPVAHNKNWRDKRTGEARTKTTWVNCTIWKKEGANLRILDSALGFLDAADSLPIERRHRGLGGLISVMCKTQTPGLREVGRGNT